MLALAPKQLQPVSSSIPKHHLKPSSQFWSHLMQDLSQPAQHHLKHQELQSQNWGWDPTTNPSVSWPKETTSRNVSIGNQPLAKPKTQCKNQFKQRAPRKLLREPGAQRGAAPNPAWDVFKTPEQQIHGINGMTRGKHMERLKPVKLEGAGNVEATLQASFQPIPRPRFPQGSHRIAPLNRSGMLPNPAFPFSRGNDATGRIPLQNLAPEATQPLGLLEKRFRSPQHTPVGAPGRCCILQGNSKAKEGAKRARGQPEPKPALITGVTGSPLFP